MTVAKWRGPWIGKVADAPTIPLTGTFNIVPTGVSASTWTLTSGTDLAGQHRVGVPGQKYIQFTFAGAEIYLNGSATPTPIGDLPAGFTVTAADGLFTLSDAGGVPWDNDPSGEFNFGNVAFGTTIHEVNSEASTWTPCTMEDATLWGFIIYCTNDSGGIVQLETYVAAGASNPMISGTYEVL